MLVFRSKPHKHDLIQDTRDARRIQDAFGFSQNTHGLSKTHEV
jgi:hypothetical protein